MITPNHLQIKFSELAKMSHMKIQLDENLKLSDEEFYEFCQQNRELKFERTKEGNIIVMTPTGLETGNRNSEINGDLIIWNRRSKYGKVFDSSTGFRLPNGSVFAPDASVVSQARWDALSSSDRKKFAHICPEFVIELKSESDRTADLQTKMQEWLTNGIRLGWLIDADTETVYVYEPGKPIVEVNGFDNVISGEPVLPGFTFDLRILRV